MLTLGPLAFAHPWLLMALAGLPGLYWLLRLTPPAPKSVHFPPLRLLLQLVTREETPARTPLWLLLLRIAVAMLVILSVARPVLNPAPALEGSGPVVIVLDDGWAAASHWNQRISTLDTVLVQAERDNREIVLVRSAPGENGIAVQRFDAITARESLVGLEPRPWPVDRAATGQAIAELALHEATSIWLTDGLVAGEATPGPAIQLAEQLGQLGSLTIVTPADGERAILLDIPEPQSQGLLLSVERAGSEGERPVSLNAIGPDGEVLARVRESIPDGDRQLDMQLDLPAELLGHVARIEITGEESAGATVLFDERWRRRSVGIAAPSQSSVAQPLLAESYYLSRALSPFATVREGSVEELLDQPISLLVLTDQKQIEDTTRSLLDPWMRKPVAWCCASPVRDLPMVMTILYRSAASWGSQPGQALSWSTPLAMAPMPADSPLAGIDISEEVTVTQQVLAQPSAELAGATLASLEDGTSSPASASAQDG
ncbi:MAG: BatA domain-containing protein [Geminicoccaceae bacterium]